MVCSSSDSDLVLVKNVTSIVWDYFRLKATACKGVIDSEASPLCAYHARRVFQQKEVALCNRHPDLYYLFKGWLYRMFLILLSSHFLL